ncbi:MAG: glycosyltransferase family 4 protein [Ruminococcaceae bacterium]|nr:glycosyltransferase family 4 protein [Oscillospiraceae bacterium]
MFILEVSYGCPCEAYPRNGIFQYDQAKSLKDAGHRIVFLAMDMRSIRRVRRFGRNEFLKDDIPVLEYNIPFGPIFYNAKSKMEKFLFEKGLKRVIKKYGKPDLVHAHFAETARCVVGACKKYNIPYVVTEHGSLIHKLEENSDLFFQIENVYKNAEKVIAVSSGLADIIKSKFDVDSIVISNIADLSRFQYIQRTIEKEKFNLLASGNLIKGKGFDVLLKAFKKVSQKNKDCKLTIMGGGPEEANLKNLAQQLGIQEKVSFFGAYNREQFAEELNKAALFVLASRYETFGIVYIEAMATGLPVIATKCGGPEDFVNSTNGVLVPVDDVETLAKEIEKMMNSENVYDCKEISDSVHHKFSPEVIAKQITKVFEEVVNG